MKTIGIISLVVVCNIQPITLVSEVSSRLQPSSLWYCPSKVSSLSDLYRYGECCFHKHILSNIRGASSYCGKVIYPDKKEQVGYVSGNLANVFTNLYSKSLRGGVRGGRYRRDSDPQDPGEQCCDAETETITNGVCGSEADSGCVTFLTDETAPNITVCNDAMTSHNWCENAGPTTAGGRKKRGNCPACHTSIYNIWYCPFVIPANNGQGQGIVKLDRYPICCFHPVTHRMPRKLYAKDYCCEEYQLCF
eukprot:GFUD01024466.1.p1 GENE.GFUD01024466.1~~GFUD01024466.1.p1  ORF type:complete len:249 (-),score=15.87 GFUD01024466.1:169-915(-)